MTRWKFTGFDDDADGAAEYVDAATGEAYYHRPSPRICWVCRIEYVSPGKIYCPECAALQRALLRRGKDQDETA
jgi:hypothetical protein